MNVLIKSGAGYALYIKDALVATWGPKESEDYIQAQIALRLGEEIVPEIQVRDTQAFTEKLSAQVKSKLKSEDE